MKLLSQFSAARTQLKPASLASRWGVALIVLMPIICATSFWMGFQNALIGLTGVAFVAAAVGAFSRPVGLIGVSLVCTLDPLIRVFVAGQGLLRWNTFNYGLFALVILNAAMLLRVRALPMIWLLPLVALMALQLFYSADVMEGLQSVVGLASCLGVFVFFWRGRTEWDGWLWAGLTTGVLGAAGGLVYLVPLAQVGGFVVRVTASAVGSPGAELAAINANAWAQFPLAAIFSVCLAARVAVRQRASKKAMWLVILAFINGGWVFLSGSRGAMVCAIPALLYILLAVRHERNIRITVISIAVLVAAISIQFSSMGRQALDRFGNLLDSERSVVERSSGRANLLEVGWDMFLQHPFTGVGTGSFPIAYEQTRVSMDVSFGETRMEAHSGWIKVLAENGFVGALLLLFFVLSFSRAGYLRRAEGLYPLGLLATTVLALGLVSTEFQSKGLWLLIGGVMSALAEWPAPVFVSAPQLPRLMRVRPNEPTDRRAAT